jgi:hypothetical protein
MTGVFSTMPIVTVNVGNGLISVFSMLFALLFTSMFIMAVKSIRGFRLGNQSSALVMWFLLSVLASIVGSLYFNADDIWINQALSYIPKLLLYLSLLLFALKVEDIRGFTLILLKGFIAGCLINLLWTLMEAYSYYALNVPLNDALFIDYVKGLGEGRPTMTIISDGIIRASGLNYDPAHLGGIIPIVFLYSILKRNMYVVLLCLISLVVSGSTTALVASGLAIFVSVGKLNLFKNVASANNRKKFGLPVLFAIVMLVISGTNETIRESLTSNAIGFYQRVTENYVENPDRGERYVYHAYLPDAISNSGFAILTGTGLGTASHPYVSDPHIAQLLPEGYVASYAYDPESTYISYLFDTGIVGLILYLYVLVSLILRYRRRLNNGNDGDWIIYAGLCGVLFSGLFYHYILTAYQMLILIFAATNIDRDKKAASFK